MRILGIDAAASAASAALVEDGLVIGEECSEAGHDPRPTSAVPRANHAETLLSLIETVLRRSGRALSEVDGVAVSIGPGSFTGLRVALGTVKGFAVGWGVPVVGISTLWANAARVRGAPGLVCSCLDARKKEVYAALFAAENGGVRRLTEDAVLSVPEMIETSVALAAGRPLCFFGDGAVAYRALIEQGLGGAAEIRSGEGCVTIAASTALLAERRLRARLADPVASLVPIYLRRGQGATEAGKGDKCLKSMNKTTLTKPGP
ncbi:MAG TPA: tRNA (adenosine(37)-N6)-threonylcarbamoyltransferase complex dimerization subunit type 1 TsaB [candidate division Zixibacteria bacterium]|nr:tRNA (adenosine(37)-N6)-threonylcarbamoyltransferase complex dimerization subunit type 1 TsaB [candidate division Zixibacteria bacterium]